MCFIVSIKLKFILSNINIYKACRIQAWYLLRKKNISLSLCALFFSGTDKGNCHHWKEHGPPPLTSKSAVPFARTETLEKADDSSDADEFDDCPSPVDSGGGSSLQPSSPLSGATTGSGNDAQTGDNKGGNIFKPLCRKIWRNIFNSGCRVPPDHQLLDSALILDHSYLIGRLPSSKIVDTKVSGL